MPEHKTVAIETLTPYPGNARKGDLNVIKQSLREHGQYRTIVVQESTGYVLAGNHTYQAAVEEGFTNIDATFVDVTDDQAKKIVLVDNRSNDLAEYDMTALAELLASLDTYEGTGYEAQDVSDLLDSLAGGFAPGKDVDAVPEAPERPVTVLGDVILLGRHRLMCGDSTDIEHVATLMDGAKAQLLLTDPPYGVDYDGGMKRREKLDGDHLNTAIYREMRTSIIFACEERAPLYIWLTDTFLRDTLQAFDEADWVMRSLILWVKNNAQFMTGAQYKQKHEFLLYAHRKGKAPYWNGPNNEVTVWECDRSPRNDFHPTQKPVELVERVLRNSSDERDRVVDLFGGSGSTMIGCESMKRVCYTMEKSPAYCDVMVARWENLTGNAAERL